MNDCPSRIDDANVVLWATVDDSVRPTGNTVHECKGSVLGPVPRLAIVQYDGADDYYLLYCDERWELYTDTYRETIDEAKAQAEFEYEGIGSHWNRSI